METDGKNVFSEILKSDEVKECFRELLKEQTDDISHLILQQAETRQNEELSAVKNQLKAEKEKRTELERSLSEIAEQNEKLESRCKELKSRCDSLNQEILAFHESASQLQQKLKEAEADCDKTEQKANEKEKEYQSEITVLKNRLSYFEDKYAGIDEAFLIYSHLSTEVKQRLKNIFGFDNLCLFIASVGKWDNVTGMWDFAKRRIIEADESDTESLVYLFRFLFSEYKNCTGSQKYKLISPAIGEEYDSDMHSIIGIKTDGKITAVLLDGIYDAVSGKTVCKAIVEV